MMIRFMFALWVTAVCFGQAKQNVVQTGVVDARGANWIPPTARFANPPSAPPTGSVYVFTDAGAVGSCTGGGGSLAACRWSGAAWEAVGGGGGASSQASIFSGGSRVQRAVECASGTVNISALTAAAPSQEITIQTGVSGNVRWDQVMVNPSTAFTGGAASLPTVSMGRPGTNNYEMTGAVVPIGSGNGSWTARPIPPQLTSTYSIVLNFAVATGNVNTFTAGALDWEVCGYSAR